MASTKCFPGVSWWKILLLLLLLLLSVTKYSNADCAIQFLGEEPFRAFASRSTTAGTTLYQLFAVNAMTGESAGITYSLVEPNSIQFTVMVETGKLILNSRFTSLVGYNLTIEAQSADQADRERVNIIVEVIPELNAEPRFEHESYSLSVLEDLPVGRKFSVVRAFSLATTTSLYVENYDIVGGTSEGEFDIESTSGVLTIHRVLNREARDNYILIIQFSFGSRSIFSEVQINVLDANDNAPEFAKMVYNISLDENLAVPSSVLTVLAIDPDSGMSGMVQYFLDSSVEQQFSLNSMSGNLLLTTELDYENVSVYQFTITARDEGSPSLNSTVIVVVNVVNIDDECPRFQNPLFTAHHPASVSGDLVTVVATDPDRLSEVMYSIVSTSGSNSSMFSINSLGVISLSTSGDSSGRYLLNVSASDATCSMRSFVPVEIRIGDGNSFSPEFSSCEATLMENPALHTEVVTLRAVDRDHGFYGSVTYSLFDTTFFSINASTGVVRTTQSPSSYDRESMPVHRIGVLARDGGLRQDYCLLTITLEDKNDNAPAFTILGYNTTLSSTASVGTTLVHVRAVDNDLGPNGNVTYSLNFSPDLSQGPFSVDTSGVVMTTGLLNTRSEYMFTVIATDRGTPPLSSNIVINAAISETNSFPVFQESYYSTTLCDASRPVGPVLTVNATNAVFYSIISGVVYQSNSNGVFLWASDDSLQLGSSEVINFELLGPTKSFLFPIEATNRDGSSLTTVEIFVRDLDDNYPTLDSDPCFTLAENQPMGTIVTKIVAVDIDSGTNGEIAYRLKIPSQYFNISTDGTIRSTYVFDYENSSEVLSDILIIKAYNPNQPESNQQSQCEPVMGFGNSVLFPVNWRILDQNDNPPSFNIILYRQNSSEDGQIEITFNASDPDVSDRNHLHYSIISGNDGTFAVEENRLVLVSRLDFERKQSYNLSIIVTDGVHSGLTCPRCSATVFIRVIDVDDTPPVFTNSFYTTELAESSAIGTSVLSVLAEDVDTENVQYWLSLQAQGMFTISASGIISVSGSLDREWFSDGVVSFLVFADGGFSASARVNVTLLDVNDHAPRFEAVYSGSIQENLMPGVDGMFVVQVRAVDSDQGQNGTVMYQLASGMEHGFMIDSTSGTITAHAMYDREIQPSYLLTVLAVDDGLPTRLSSSTLVSVEIGDVNDNTPFFPFPFMFARIFENASFGAHVLNIPATDLDNGVNARITYTLVSSSISNKFALNSTTGEVTVTGSLDYELPKHRSSFLIVSIRDPQNHGEMMGNLSITLLDLNDNTPRVLSIDYNPTFGMSHLIHENVPPGPLLATVVATDDDQGSNGELAFSIIGGNEGGEFEISSIGEVRNTRLLDYETNDSYDLSIVVSDRGSPTESVVIMLTFLVGDINDNSPSFASEVYRASVSENVAAMPSILQVSATDPDSGDAGVIGSYDIVSGNIREMFNLNPTSGILGTNSEFDREDIDSYTLIVSASDRGTDSQTGTAVVQVNIIDVNDNPTLSGGLTQVFMYGRDGILHNMTVAPVYFDDPDVSDTFRGCVVQFQSSMVFNINGNCLLELTQSNPEADVYMYTVTSSDGGMHTTAESDINIQVEYINSRDFPDDSTVTVTINATVNEYFSLELNTSLPTLIAQNLGVERGDLLTLSIQRGYHDPTNTLDMTFSARKNSEELMISIEIINKLVLMKDELFVGRHGIVSIPTDPCVTEPCFNQARCKTKRIVGDTQHAVSSSEYVLYAPTVILSYECDCVPGTAGNLCEINYDDCYSSPCRYDVQCTDAVQGFVCDCPEGTSGADCSFNPNECTSNPCQNGATCFNEFGRYLCACQPGFYGSECQYLYFHVSSTCDPSPCRNGGTCSTGRDTFTCLCPDGFNGALCENKVLVQSGCVGNPCHNGSSCTDTDQGPLCHCSVGFTGPYCKWPINNCELNPCKNNATCEQGFYGSYLCTCPVGYTGINCTVRLSACRSSPCLNGGRCIDNSEDGSFICQCPHQFSGLLCEINLLPIDFCSDSSSSQFQCSGNCTSGSESYTCTCPAGFYGRNCSLVSDAPCSSNPCQYGGTCVLNPSANTGYTCQCSLGFTGSDCEVEVDECSSNPCLNGGMCLDGVGGFICNCSAGVTGNVCQIHCPAGREGVFCKEESQYCMSSSCLNGGTCIERTDRFECLCPITHTGLKCETENRCSTARCSNAGTCTDLATGGSECSCVPGFEGKDCELLTASFSGGSTTNSFRAFQPLGHQGQVRIMLEFATRAADGLLLYSTQYQEGRSEDFIAAEVVGGYVRVGMSHGSGRGGVALTNSSVRVDDGSWHQMTIETSGKSFSVSLDQCHMLDEGLLALSACQLSATTPGTNSFLNLGLPLWIGGVPLGLSVSSGHISSVGFSGCIGNVTVDNDLIDLEAFIEQQSSERGCGQVDAGCSLGGEKVCGGGNCVPFVDGYSCICPPRRVGDNCERNAESLMFSGGSYAQYSLNDDITTSTTTVGSTRRKRQTPTLRTTLTDQLSFRFRTELDQGVLFQIGQVENSRGDFVFVEITIGGSLNYHINLGSGEETIAFPSDLPAVNDAEWHIFESDRFALDLRLTLDNLTMSHTLEGALEGYQLYLNVDHSHFYAGGTPSQSNTPNIQYIGCLEDVRIDQNILPTSGGNKFATVVYNGSGDGVGLGCTLRGCYPNPCGTGNCTEKGDDDFICSCNDGNSVISAPCSEPEPVTKFQFVIIIAGLLGGLLLLLICFAFIMLCWKIQNNRKYGIMHLNSLHSTPSELVLATRDCVVISNDEGGGEQDTTMTGEKWQRSCSLVRKEKSPDDSTSSSQLITSSENSIDKPVITDEVGTTTTLHVKGLANGVDHHHLSPQRVENYCPQVRAQSPVISAFIDQRLESLKQQYHDLDSVTKYTEEGNNSPAFSLHSRCSYCPEDEPYTVQRLKKAGPEFAKFQEVLEVLETEEENVAMDLESELVHTGQTQTQTEMGTQQSQSQEGSYF